MTTVLHARRQPGSTAPACPAWCTNNQHPLAAVRDMCDAGLGEWRHMGRIGSVVLPSLVDEYYDEEIGVELFRIEDQDGTVQQLSVLLTYSVEYQERGHVVFGLDEARRFVAFSHADSNGERQQARFGVSDDNNVRIEQPRQHRATRVDMNFEGHTRRLQFHPAQIAGLADLIASACILAEVAR